MKREVYPTVPNHLIEVARLLRSACGGTRHHSRTRATVPDAETIEAVMDAAFWASLRREEGYTPTISLAFLSPEETAHPLRFERPLALHPATLTRVAPAVERPGIHLGVGAARRISLYGDNTRNTEPVFRAGSRGTGTAVVKHHSGDESGKFVNVAVLEGDQIKSVDRHAADILDCPDLMTSLLGFGSPASWVHSVMCWCN